MCPISQRFAIPTDPDQFEKMCRDLLRHYWSRPGLEIFAKRGEQQYGIDILDLSGETPVYAAQCKLKEEHKSLTPAEIQGEVDKAKKFAAPLGKYGILTTAKVSRQAQMKVREINEAHKALGLFEVELLTWEILCSLLQQYSDVQELFYGEMALGRAARIEREILTIRDGVESLTSKSDGDEIDSQINDARDWITKREFQVATLLLNRVRHNAGHKLTDRQKFRVSSNLGAAALGLAKSQEAARFFLEAVTYQPNDELAKTNEVLAYFLTGDLDASHKRAESLRVDYPGSARLATLWLITAPKEVPLAALVPNVSSVLLTDPEICVTLARRALIELAFDKAEEYASSARNSAPEWSQPWLVLASISLGKALHVQMGFGAGSSSQESTLMSAEEACSKSVALAREERDRQIEIEGLVLRVDIRLMLGKTSEAVQDAEDAEKLGSDNPRVMLAVAQVRLASKRVDDGISVLRNAYRAHPRPDIGFTLGRALQSRGRDNDLEDAINILLGISLQDVPPDLRATTATQTIRCLAMKKDWARTESYLAGVSDLLDPIVVKIIYGYLAHYQSDPQGAELRAMEAQSLLTGTIDPETKEYLAQLFMLIGRPASALPLWQDLFDRGVPSFDPGNLLNCAAKLHRDDLVMQICDQLHERGINDWHLVDFETRYLEKYKIEGAVDRLKAFVVQNPVHKLAKLRLSLIGLALDRSELVSPNAEDLPSVDELPTEYAKAAVQVMKYGGNPNGAVEYAYWFLRAHFNEIEAHQALIVSMMPGSSAPDIPPSLDVAGQDAAVCYQELPHGNPMWVVLQEIDKPNSDFEEVSLTSNLAVELIGKKVGDTFVLAKGSLQDRTARITQILPKYVRRFQDSAGEMQVRFGAASTLESIQVAIPEPGSRSEGVEAILASVERRAAAVAGAREMYDSLPTSLHWYGSLFGGGAYEALMSLAGEEGQPIKCCFGTAEERSQGSQALQTAKAVVVDMTALATLRLLRLEKVLSSSKYRFVVSERTWVTLKNRLFNERIFSGPGGTMVYKDGRHVLYEETAEDKERRNQKDEEFVRHIEKTTDIRSGAALAALESSKREALEKFFGAYGAESMVLASDPDHVLWTDDLIQAQIAAQEFGARRVWTQLVLGSLTDSGLLTADEYSEASASLVGMEFATTMFDSASMLAAVRLGGWSAGGTPATQMLKIFSNPPADLPSLIRIFIGFVVRLYREPLSGEKRCEITRSFLDALGDKPAALAQLRSLRSLSSRVFGLNLIGRNEFDECFDRWAQRLGTIILDPR
jgi:tetratricopeptide (TPR) repeat protein